MRTIATLLVSVAALSIAPAAFAQPATTIAYSPEFQTSLQDEFGVREGEALQRYVHRAIEREFARRGVASTAASVDVTIVEADPNRPTMEQLGHTPGLDMLRSISIGGAELRATVRRADGSTAEVTHRRYDQSIDDVALEAPGTWTSAERAIRQFAVKVADAYAQSAG